jgi:cytochrome c oxidase subunit II
MANSAVSQRLEAVARRAGRLRFRGISAILAVILSPSAAHADAWSTLTSNMSYMVAAGTKNYGVTRLLYFVLAISVAVVLLIAIFVVIGMFRQHAAATEPRQVPVERRGNGLPWIYIGSALSLVVLFAIAIWDYVVLANVAVVPSTAAPFTIQVVGHQWWWELRYKTEDPTRTFDTANELHIPVGKPVRLLLNAADVIHSFWVPVLTGKMDTIPGQNNQTWIEAQTAGVYRGQCTEYCGLQHAKMGLLAIAEPQQQFDDWWNNQLQGAKAPELATAQQAENEFVGHCGICHTVRGTRAGGRVGPDLSHLMTRLTIASGTLPNTIGYLSGWIAEPQHLKPGNYMPDLDLSGPQLTSIRSFLQTLH